jgi:hypothetical protein
MDCRVKPGNDKKMPHLLNSPMIAALPSVLKCRLNPTTAAEVSGFTGRFSTPTANTVDR